MTPSVIGVVCSGNVAADRDEVKTLLERGIAKHPDAIWVTEPKSKMVRDLLLQLGIRPVILDLQPEWKIEGGGDYRRQMRDGDLLRMCDELIVFHKRGGSSPWRALYAFKPHARYMGRVHENLHLIDLGLVQSKGKRKPRKTA